MQVTAQISRRAFLGAAGAFAAGAVLAGAQERRRPNVILFLVDDMGWKDSATYGSTFYETPAMDRMAREGMKFTDAYATPLCSPTRAAIMSGKYPERLGFLTAAGHVPQEVEAAMRDSAPAWAKVISPGSDTYLPLEEYTVAEALRDAGYATAHFGKWHLGAMQKYWASEQGFSESLGGTGAPGPVGYFSPYFLENVPDGPEGEHLTDRVTEEVIRFMTAHRDTPFFANVWHYTAHGPWQAPGELVEKYTALADPDAPQHNPVYAGMMESMDQSLGRILDALDELGLVRNTVVIFMSDNGGLLHTETWDAHSPPYTHVSSNAPLRGGKSNLYEGGIRVPFLIRWPGKVRPGTVCTTPVHCTDLYPTILELADEAPPTQQHLDGASLLPLLTGKGRYAREAVFGHFPFYSFPHPTEVETYQGTPASYVRQGKWKLVRLYGEGADLATKDVLYNLEQDIGESRDVASTNPRTARRLAALLDRHLEDTGALLPVPNPAYQPPSREWRTVSGCTMERGEAGLSIVCTDMNATIESPTVNVPGPAVLRLRARRPRFNESRWQSYPARPRVSWRSKGETRFGAHKMTFDVAHDGAWHDIEVPLPTDQPIAQLQLMLGYAPDRMDIASLEVAYTGRYYQGYTPGARFSFTGPREP